MKKNLLISVLMTIVTTVLLGLVYPLVVTGLAQLFFPEKANGQLIRRNRTVIASHIIAQPFIAGNQVVECGRHFASTLAYAIMREKDDTFRNLISVACRNAPLPPPKNKNVWIELRFSYKQGSMRF